MPSELIAKKLEQIRVLLADFEEILRTSFEDFQKDTKTIRAAERNFQLIVDTASDINTQILLGKGKQTPDTYKQSFSALGDEGILTKMLAQQLVEGAKLRNILVHEYDIEENYEQFYASAKALLPAYREYLKQILKYLEK